MVIIGDMHDASKQVGHLFGRLCEMFEVWSYMNRSILSHTVAS